MILKVIPVIGMRLFVEYKPSCDWFKEYEWVDDPRIAIVLPPPDRFDSEEQFMTDCRISGDRKAVFWSNGVKITLAEIEDSVETGTRIAFDAADWMCVDEGKTIEELAQIATVAYLTHGVPLKGVDEDALPEAVSAPVSASVRG